MAVTNTWAEAASYNTATLSGTGTMTLNELYLDLYSKAGDAETFMSRTGSPGGYTFTWKLQDAEITNRVYIGANVTFEIEDGDTWNHVWSNSSTSYWTVYASTAGATIKIGSNVYIEGNFNSATYARGYFGGRGNIICDATAGNESEVTHFRSYYFYGDNLQPHDINYMKFTNLTYSGGYMFYCQGRVNYMVNENIVNSFKNVTFSDENGWGNFYISYADYNSWVFEDITVTNLQNGQHYFMNAKFKDCLFNEQDSYTNIRSAGFSSELANYTTSKTKTLGINRNQSLLVYENCTFDAQDAGVYNLWANQASTVLVKDCTFANASRGMTVSYSVFLLYGTQTYTNITTYDRQWSTNGTFLYVRKLTLTVKDPDGNVLENALVSVNQKENKERHQFMTDSNGQITSTDGAWVYLAEKEETSLNNFNQWSDGTGDQIHELTVSHPDYGTHKEEIAFTEDKVRTVTLDEKEGTHIYDSTIYDSTIY